jgi:hypothetical protein
VNLFEIFSIVLNAVIGVLVVVYGFWLRNVFKHQIDAKDATIQLKDAEISRLRSEAAPAIVAYASATRELAEKVSRDFVVMREQYKMLERAVNEHFDRLEESERRAERIMKLAMEGPHKTRAEIIEESKKPASDASGHE